jgi:MFS transporter, ACS family, hexuronate transporter
LLSLAWIPVWLATSQAIPALPSPRSTTAASSFGLLRDPKLWALMVANMLGMTVYSLWSNWAPTYLVRGYHLTPPQASHYTWVVPISGYFGGLLGGALSWRFVLSGRSPIAARKRACFISVLFLLGTVAIPLMPNPALATLGMSLSFSCVCAWSVNHYTLPIDIYGASRAAFGGAALVFAYGVMQAIISRPLAYVIENFGFAPVCVTFALLPMVGYLLVHLLIGDESNTEPVILQSQATLKTSGTR